MKFNIYEIFCSSFFGSSLIFLFGGFDKFLGGLILFMVFDFITGMMKGSKNNELNSKRGLEGIKKKIVMLFFVIMGAHLDTLFNSENIARLGVIFFLIGVEGLSILENAVMLGVPVPHKLREILEQCSNK